VPRGDARFVVASPPFRSYVKTQNHNKGAWQPAFNTSRETASCLAVTPDSSLRAPAAGIT